MGKTSTAAAALFAACIAFGAPQNPASATKEQVKAALDKMPARHPRIFVKSSDAFVKIRAVIDSKPEWVYLRDNIVNAADGMLNVKPAQRGKQGMRMTGQFDVSSRLGTLAAAYQLTGDKKYAERGRQEMLSAATWEDWNPSHFLDTAEMMLGFGIGYDWLYDNLDEASRKTIRAALIKKGLQQVSGNRWWKKADNNWSQVCWDGAVTAALAIRDEEPELCLNIVHEMVTSIPNSIKVYAPNGSYPEGPGYWEYGTTRFVYLLDTLEKALGTNFGLYDMPGFSKTGEYLNLVTGPSGATFDYADGGPGRSPSIAMWWLAAKENRPDWLRLETAAFRNTLAKEKGKKSTARLTQFPFLLLFWARLQDGDVPCKMPLDYSSEGPNPIVVMRSSWDNATASFLATKGGRSNYNHEHQDIGEFVYDCDGVRWAADIGGENYYNIEKLGIGLWDSHQNGDRWKIFRLGNLSHNVVTIDGRYFNVKGFGNVEKTDFGKDASSATIEMNDVYAGQAKTAKRTCALDRKTRAAIISDEFTGVKSGANVRWAMVTQAESVEINGSDVTLKARGKQAILRAVVPAAVSWQVVDLSKPMNTWDSPCKGMKLLSFTQPAPENGSVAYKVTLAPR